MIKTTFADHHSWTRTFVAFLIISLLILSPLAPLAPSAAAAPKSSRTAIAPPAEPSSVSPVEPAVAPLVPDISATKTDSFPDPNGDGKAAPGETITYDVNITNNGTDASGVNFTDTIDSNTTLVGGSLKVSPLAFADAYSAAKDTQLVVGTPGVLVNDTGLPAPTAVAIAGGATTQGGTVTLNTDGSFTYNPPVGFTGTDTFTYTATNSLTPNDTATVTITVNAAPSVANTTPANGASNQSQNTDIAITFSEPVNVTGNWFQIACTTSGTRNVADTVVTGGPTTFTINPAADFATNETCTVTVFAAQVSDQDTNDPPDNMTADFIFSFATADAAPSVTSTTPTNGASNQLTNTDITVTFSEPVNVTGNWFQIVCGSSGTRNPADTVVTGGPTTFTINPNTDFSAAETCTVTIFAAQVVDQDTNDPPDNMTANFVFNFSTESAPTVNATTPTNGATQVPNNSNITLTFSEPVDVTGNWFQIVGATSGTRNVADTVVTGGPTTFTINPNVDFANGELVTVTVFAAQVTDQDTGDPPDNMAANFVFSFTIDQAPSVTGTTPTNGANNQALNTNVSITFSEPVNVTGNWFQIACTTSGTRNPADTVVSGGPTTFTINPNADFVTSETCTVTVFAAQVTDQDSGDPPDNMTANFVFSFQTIDAAPTVTATTPTNGATSQAINTDITVTFSEPVNVGATWFTIACPTSGARTVADTVVTGGPTTFTINPNTDFAPSEICTVTIVATQVTDQDTNDPPDNMAANFVFSFTMDGPPAVTTTTPTNGATQVAANTNITINFNENVNIQDATAFTVECPVATPIAFTVTPVAPGGINSFVLDPTSDLPLGTICTVTVVASKVTDVNAGDPPDNMAANFVFSFTTDQAPSVTTTTPADNAVNVLQSSTVTINFSENVNVAENAVTINCGSAVTLPAAPQNNITSLLLSPTLPAGSTCTVTVDKTKVSDTDAGDPPDNMVNDHVFSFKVKPDAVNDVFPANVVGNVRINTAGFPFSITTNDVSANAFSISAVQAITTVVTNTITATSANGGTIVMIVSGTDRGKFIYNPAPGFEGTDSFSYTISRDDGGGTDTASVNIPVAGMIWFINNAASCPCDGRLTNPFNAVAAFNALNNGAGNNPAAGDNIFLYESATSYTGPLTLLNNQKLIGQDATATLSTITGLTPPNGSDPLPAVNSGNGTIVNITSAGIGITVAQNNLLRGFTGGNATTDISGSGFGTLTVSDVTLNGTGQALSLTNGTLAAIFGGISSTNSATTGISLTTVGGSLTSGSTTISNPTGIGISVNTSSGTLNFGNTVSTLSGGTGVSLTTNTGAILFGILDISPDNSQRGLLATDNTQTITTTSGTIVTNGAAGVEISRASSTTPLAVALTSVSTTGGPNGIFLRNTSGNFSVNGDGTNATVGGNNSGGTISGMTGADGATSGNGVYLENAANVTLRRIRINGTNQNHGIRGVNSSNFILEFSTVNGSNGTSAGLDEGSVNFDNLTGTAAITSCLIEGGFEDNLNIINTSGTLNRLTISGSTFGFNNTANGNNNILIQSQNAGTTLNFTLKSSIIKGARADWITAINNSGSTMDAVIGGPLVADGNTFDNLGVNAHPGAAAGSNRLVTTSVGNQTVDIRNNTLKGSIGVAMLVRATIVGATRGILNARVRNNTIGVAATPNSGSTTNGGIALEGDGGSQINAAITSNSVFQYNNHGILLEFGDEIIDGAAYNVTVTQNTVSNPGSTPGFGSYSGISLNNGTVNVPLDVFTTCADIGGAGVGNSVANSGNALADIRLRQRQGTTVRLPGYAGSNNNNAQVVTYLLSRNTATTAAALNTAPVPGGGFIGGAACTAPSFAMVNPQVTNQRDYFASAAKPARNSGPSKSAASTSNAKTKQTVSHHPKATKRNSAPVRNATVANTTVAKPVVNKTVGQQQPNAMQDKKPRRGISVRPTVAPLAGETVSHSIGTLLAGKTVRITFQVTVNSPYLGGPTVSNQGTISSPDLAQDVLTQDVPGGGPTLTPIQPTPNVSAADAQANEPASGTAQMLFTVSLSSPAPAEGASVHYSTADQSIGAGHAVAGVDYVAIPETPLNFAGGEQVKVVAVTILADPDSPEPDETFLFNLTNAANAVIVDAEAVGTIKQGSAAGTFLISEFRTSGPGGEGDDFVEVYNNTDSPLTVAASDESAGYGLFKKGVNCSATPVLIGVIPNGTVIPARGHFLFVGSAYSLTNYGGTGAAAGNLTMSEDIQPDTNIAIFNTSSVTNLSSVTRLDAVGLSGQLGANCLLLSEGGTLTPPVASVLEYSFHRDQCGKKGNPAIFGPCPSGGFPADTNDNQNDFVYSDTSGTATPQGQRLGAPGPENVASPGLRNAITTLLLDSNIGAPAPPNRVRDLTPLPSNGANGTLSVRRRFVNNTGAPVTRLRFRIVDISSISVPGGIADVRALTSTSVVVSGITDAATCLASTGSATTPCTVTVLGTTLEQPPAQPLGGALNSSMSAGTITLAASLAPGASINLQFLLGVQQTGSFKFFFNIEALP